MRERKRLSGAQQLAMLKARREEVARLLGEIEGGGNPSRLDADFVEGVTDDVDRATTFRGREATGAVTELLSVNRDQITEALERLEAGAYGTCEDCGRPIPHERLQIWPEATRCVSCQRRQDALAGSLLTA